ALVFCNRKDEVRRLAETLARYGIACAELSGDIPQQKRLQRLEQFKSGRFRVLVATDVAGRGLHIEGMDHVINFNLPHDPEDYVHRIGRTGRAGAAGTSISFADEAEAFYLPPIEAFMGRKLSCIQPEEEWLSLSKPTGQKRRDRYEKPRQRSRLSQKDAPSRSGSRRRRPARPRTEN
ncbi:MAG: helicase-related protein, partial [Thermodesulfobacteriota bacterium]